MQNLTNKISVTGQITVDDLNQLKNKGIEMIICLRPDHEESNQPEFEAIQHAANVLNIDCIYAPFNPGEFPVEALPITKEALNENKNTLMYCKSGTRAVIVWALIEAEKQKDIPQIIDHAAELGFGIGQLKQVLEAQARKFNAQ